LLSVVRTAQGSPAGRQLRVSVRVVRIARGAGCAASHCGVRMTEVWRSRAGCAALGNPVGAMPSTACPSAIAARLRGPEPLSADPAA
jgi:hypothetical protein